MRIQSKVVDITGSTAAQMETALNNQSDKGWTLKMVFTMGTKTYAVLERTIAE